jgi:hypothetical protein
MAKKTIYESPTITDTVVIPILTPDVNNCFLSDPYLVNNLTIYYVERDFSRGNTVSYDALQKNKEAEQAAIDAQNLACVSPTEENIEKAKSLRTEANSMVVKTQVYYNEAVPVAVVGNSNFPAWLSTDTANAFLTHITEDEDGNTIYGNFSYEWNPIGMREGNYIACWTWTPLPAGETLSANLHFALMGNTAITTSIPTHFTPAEKYDVLLERYLPEVYKDPLSDFDLSPQVLALFNNSVAKGFTTLEDLANQIIDIQDANATSEAFLGMLARTFGMSLRSDDPTRWRKQIKKAIPLYKKKGTRAGLEEAFSLAGMTLTRLVRMWQIISPYTWVDAFKASGGEDSFTLTKVALAIDPNNFEVAIRYSGDENYTVLSNGDINIINSGGMSVIEITNPAIMLEAGDIFKVMYQYTAIPNPTAQDIEDYIRLLPLGDQRDETAQEYPPKNWNVRVLEEDDPLFSILIPVKHPFHDTLVFGKIRTEFPYSENVYNMEEYNGSIRESKDPCHIDKDFVDPCSQCLGSKFSIEVAIDNLSNDRILEAQSIISEYVPFHAVPHAINYSGTVTDFVQPPVETIECLIFYRGSETVISGEAQIVFNRGMIDNGRPLSEVFRNTLANSSLVASGTGTAFNNRIMLFSPDTPLDRIGMSDDPNDTVFEIFGPHPHAGRYRLSNAVNHAAQVSGPISPTVAFSEPINQSAFSYSLSNITYSNTNTAIVPDNAIKLIDTAWNLGEIGVRTQWDVDNSYPGPAWKIKLPAYSVTPYTIQNTTPDGGIVLAYDATLPTVNTTSVAYQIIRPDLSVASTGSLSMTVNRLGKVTLTDGTLTDIRPWAKAGGKYFMYYADTGVQYEINEILDDKVFHISGWAGGSVAGKTIDIYQRLVDTQYGLLTYEGIGLQTVTNYETGLMINNGNNPTPVPLEDSRFKENFLIVINDPINGAVNEIFGIAEINGTTITLEGDMHYWKTISGGGTSVPFQIYRYQTVPVTVDGLDFQRIDRRGSEVITSETELAMPFAMAMAAPSSGPSDTVQQEENITYRIEYADGTTEEGSI